ncbi:MAG: hypothetical protein ACLQBX_10925 [Candidatus Limnocylindrales bacterium]
MTPSIDSPDNRPLKADGRDRRSEDGEIAGTARVRNNTPGLQQACLELLRGPAHTGPGALPISIRGLFYEMLQARTQTEDDPSSDLSEAITRLRQAGEIPWTSRT